MSGIRKGEEEEEEGGGKKTVSGIFEILVGLAKLREVEIVH